MWIRDRKRFRKGNRKRRRKRKKRLTALQKRMAELDRLERAIRRVNTLAVTDAVQNQIRKAPEARLRRLEVALLPIIGLVRTIQFVRL